VSKDNTNLKEHTLNLINALVNLSPSRNIISQFILQLPKDLPIIEHSYREVSLPEAKEILEKYLGVQFDDVVKRSDNSFAASLYTYIHRFFEWLDDNEIRSYLSKIMGLHTDSIHNPYAEWAELVLKKLLCRPDGDKIIRFLEMLIDHNLFLVDRYGYSRGARRPDWQPFLNKIQKVLEISPSELEEIKKVTIWDGTPESIECICKENLESVYSEIYVMHSEYHLDLILSKKIYYSGTGYSNKYDHYYELKHKNTLKKLLMEKFT